jgi:polyferredoxin
LKKTAVVRFAVQVTVFASALFLSAAVFHMLCPFGGITTLTRLVQQGLYVPKTGLTNLILLGSVLLVTLIAGPVFCGWLCPLGSVQDWIRTVARKIAARLRKGKSVRATRNTRAEGRRAVTILDRVLSFSKYALLVLILYATARIFNLVFIKVDPYFALMHFWTGEVGPVALGVLAAVLILSTVTERPWCRWFCPLGAILGPLGKMSLIKIRKPSSACITCGACARVCPAGLNPAAAETVTSTRCVRCGLCAPACPPKLRASRKTFLLTITSALVLGAVFFTVPSLVGEQPVHTATDSDGQIAAFELTPLLSLSALASGTGQSVEAVYAALGIPEEYAVTTRLIDIEDDYEDITWAAIQDWYAGTVAAN